jgi:RNA polymerase sigma-70 factor (ECF subfamily)
VTEPSPEGAAERSELQRAVRSALDSLDFKQRVVLVLFYLQDFSVAEIAEILECPVGTVKSRLHYGRENLRRQLGEQTQSAGRVLYEFG